MKKISEYRKLLGVEEKADLKELKSVYRNFMKQWHPDKFQDDKELNEAQEKSKEIIEAYHFLVSISPETHHQNFEEYSNIISSSAITNIQYQASILKITYEGGNGFEYFGVPKALYVKLVNADTPGRFARRHICGSFIYRNVSRMEVTT
jgi:curved DNA-binding protein CbpA